MRLHTLIPTSIRPDPINPEVRRRWSTPLPICERDILPQRNVFTVCITQRLSNLRTMQTPDASNLRCRVVHHRAPNLEWWRVM